MIYNNLLEDKRGVSEVLGYILIFGIVMASVSIVVVFGFPTLNTARDAADFQKTKNQMQILQLEMSEISRGPIRGEGLSFSKEFNINKGTMEVSSQNSLVKIYKNDSLMYSGQIGEVKYTSNDKIIAYQNNGLFTKSIESNSSYFLVKPPIQCDLMNSTTAYVNFNVINLTGENTKFSGTQELIFIHNNFNIITEANESPETSKFTIEIHTNYVGGWQSALDKQIDEEEINYSITTSSDTLTLEVTNTPNQNDIFLNIYETKIGVNLK